MNSDELDEVDHGILDLLQQDARDLTPVDMAKELPVSEGTVRNRIKQMEEQDIIEGYVPIINYGKAGFPLEVVFTCTAPIDRIHKFGEKALEAQKVIKVREMLSSQANIQIVALATSLTDILSVAIELSKIGLTIENQRFTLRERIQPFSSLGKDVLDGE